MLASTHSRQQVFLYQEAYTNIDLCAGRRAQNLFAYLSRYSINIWEPEESWCWGVCTAWTVGFDLLVAVHSQGFD